MTEIRAVISDFGGVLTSPLLHSFAAFQLSTGIPLDALGRAMAAVGARDGVNPLFRLERGEMTERDFLRSLGDAISEDLGRPVQMHGFADAYWAHLSLNEPMIELMGRLRDDGYRMALLTNNVREWEPRGRAMFAVDEIFELVIDSAFVGTRKPEPAIYDLTLERLGEPAEACVFVDDIEVNVDAARSLGMTGIWFRDTGQAIAEIEAAVGG